MRKGYKFYRRIGCYLGFICPFLLLITFTSCRPRPPIPPIVHCDRAPPPGRAAICIHAATIELGPADEITGYSPIDDLIVSLIPQDDLDSSAAGGTPLPLFAVHSIRELELSLSNSYLTDNNGKLSLEIEPGPYLLCAMSSSWDKPQRTTRCEPVTLQEQNPARLSIRYSPRGGYLGFTWE